MKKKNLKTLKLGKSSVSNLNSKAIKAGSGPSATILGHSCIICWPTEGATCHTLRFTCAGLACEFAEEESR